MIVKFCLALLVSLVITNSVLARDQEPTKPLAACSNQVPYGFPQTSRSNTVEICRQAYALLHDNSAKVASWVVYTLKPDKTIGCAPRINSFAPDLSIAKGQRAELIDYDNSGYDTGHLANNADMSWHPTVAKESFILSNMAPQLPSLNRGLWKQLETIVRAWAHDSSQGVTIYTGSIYDLNEDKRIGPNKVIVPHAFYKIVINNDKKQTLAFLFPHRNHLGSDLRNVQTTVKDIEQRSGVSFPIPDDKVARNTLWSWNLQKINSAKKLACGS